MSARRPLCQESVTDSLDFEEDKAAREGKGRVVQRNNQVRYQKRNLSTARTVCILNVIASSENGDNISRKWSRDCGLWHLTRLKDEGLPLLFVISLSCYQHLSLTMYLVKVVKEHAIYYRQYILRALTTTDLEQIQIKETKILPRWMK